MYRENVKIEKVKPEIETLIVKQQQRRYELIDLALKRSFEFCKKNIRKVYFDKKQLFFRFKPHWYSLPLYASDEEVKYIDEKFKNFRNQEFGFLLDKINICNIHYKAIVAIYLLENNNRPYISFEYDIFGRKINKIIFPKEENIKEKENDK